MAAASPPLLAPATPAPSLLPSASLRPSPTSTSATSPTADTPPNLPSLTSKEWIIPPRPKPGRKPAMDTPPTKRKAQNRAAQRAFRERRAARVGELEEQLKETEEERQKRESAMHDRITEQSAEISRLEEDIHSLRDNVTTWRSRYLELQRRF